MICLQRDGDGMLYLAIEDSYVNLAQLPPHCRDAFKKWAADRFAFHKPGRQEIEFHWLGSWGEGYDAGMRDHKRSSPYLEGSDDDATWLSGHEGGQFDLHYK